MIKPIITTHQHPILESFHTYSNPITPEYYEGFIYLWKCLPENKYYLGSHKGSIHDQYRGSGSRFRKCFEYYGITQFQRVILEYIIDKNNIKSIEQKWINTFNAIKSPNFYNMKNAKQ